MASWQAAVLELVDREHGEKLWAESLAQVVAAFNAPDLPVIRLVEVLGPHLTGEDDAQRSRATAVLAEVVEAAPNAAATESEVVHLTQFFTSRLTDWPAVRGALRGCLALLSRRAPPPLASPADQQQQQAAPASTQLPAPSGEDAVEMMRACAQHVFVRALAAPDRQLALRLLAAALRSPLYGQALVAANLDLLEYAISSVDGEKDPRCLLLGFEAVRALLGLYHAQPQHSLCHDRLEEGAEELFEVLACYFPVTFTPPPGDPHRITRADLAAGLQACLAAEPGFAPHVVPLICEKLGSSLRQAKLDALSLLGACAAGYGPAPLADHTSTIWAALRAELSGPAAEGLLPADLAAADELAAAASDALARCVAAAQAPADGQEGRPADGASLADAVLADPLLTDVLACVRSPGGDPAVHRRSALRAKAGVRAARALCAAGGPAAAKALGQLLPPLLDVAGEPAAGSSDSSWQARCLAWAAAVDLLEAAAAAPAGSSVLPADTAALLQRAAAAAAAGLAAAAAEQQAGVAAMEEGDEDDEEEGAGEGGSGSAGIERWALHPTDCSQQQAAALQLAALATLFGDARQVAALEQQQLEAGVSAALLLLSAASRSRRRQQAAVAPLTALAGSSRAAVLAEGALPRLVAAAGDPQSAGAALTALRALATASSSLQLEIVVALDQAIQQQLPAAVAVPGAGSSDGSDSTALSLQLLAAATAIVSAASAAGGAAAAPAPAFLQLGQHLMDSVLLLPQQPAAGPELMPACAELAYHAVRGAAADQQQPLAAAAADALQEQQALGPLQAAVCCALLTPLWPEAANACGGGQMPALVQRLAGLAVEQREEGPLARWAGLAAASLLNKWSADAATLSACASAVFAQHLYPACGLASDGAPPAGAPAAWGCLAAAVRGLAMRGCRDADAAVSRVVASLDAAAQSWQQQQQPDAGLVTCAAAAARFLGAVLDGGSGSGSEASPGLGKHSHAATRPLWQQRLYTTTATQLLRPLQHSQQAAAAVSGSQAEPSQASPVLLLALGQLLRAAPGAVLQHDQPRMLPWLLECLAGLQAGPLADGQLLLALLLLLSDALLSDTGRRQVEQELLPRLVPALLGLLRFRAAPAVRETALQCLLLLVELPYTALHPYRRTVAAALAAAVDDDRRAVRLAAARCRQAWTAA